jgi:hypothetical protein
MLVLSYTWNIIPVITGISLQLFSDLNVLFQNPQNNKNRKHCKMNAGMESHFIGKGREIISSHQQANSAAVGKYLNEEGSAT